MCFGDVVDLEVGMLGEDLVGGHPVSDHCDDGGNGGSGWFAGAGVFSVNAAFVVATRFWCAHDRDIRTGEWAMSPPVDV